MSGKIPPVLVVILLGLSGCGVGAVVYFDWRHPGLLQDHPITQNLIAWGAAFPVEALLAATLLRWFVVRQDLYERRDLRVLAASLRHDRDRFIESLRPFAGDREADALIDLLEDFDLSVEGLTPTANYLEAIKVFKGLRHGVPRVPGRLNYEGGGSRYVGYAGVPPT